MKKILLAILMAASIAAVLSGCTESRYDTSSRSDGGVRSETRIIDG